MQRRAVISRRSMVFTYPPVNRGQRDTSMSFAQGRCRDFSRAPGAAPAPFGRHEPSSLPKVSPSRRRRAPSPTEEQVATHGASIESSTAAGAQLSPDRLGAARHVRFRREQADDDVWSVRVEVVEVSGMESHALPVEQTEHPLLL